MKKELGLRPIGIKKAVGAICFISLHLLLCLLVAKKSSARCIPSMYITSLCFHIQINDIIVLCIV